MREVSLVARAQIVDADDQVAFAKQAIGEVRAEKSSGAGYECGPRAVPQLTCPFWRLARWIFLGEKSTQELWLQVLQLWNRCSQISILQK
jgi:hypothetical protein